MKATPRPPEVLPLRDGERLKRAEFHRLYEQCPEDVKFELIGGVVYMTSPLSEDHASAHSLLGGAFFLYQVSTPGVRTADNATTILGDEDEPQPDLSLRILAACGGQSRVNEDGYLEGAPELLAEVSKSRQAVDLGPRLDAYRQAGVLEYLVVRLEDQAVSWFDFRRGNEVRPRQGVYRSRIFPGLWIDGRALLAGRAAEVAAAVPQGIATSAHETFVRRLERERRRRAGGGAS